MINLPELRGSRNLTAVAKENYEAIMTREKRLLASYRIGNKYYYIGFKKLEEHGPGKINPTAGQIVVNPASDSKFDR